MGSGAPEGVKAPLSKNWGELTDAAPSSHYSRTKIPFCSVSNIKHFQLNFLTIYTIFSTKLHFRTLKFSKISPNGRGTPSLYTPRPGQWSHKTTFAQPPTNIESRCDHLQSNRKYIFCTCGQDSEIRAKKLRPPLPNWTHTPMASTCFCKSFMHHA